MLFLVPDLQPLSIGKVCRVTQTASFLCLHRTERAGRMDGWMDGLHPDEFNRTWRFDCVLVKKNFRSCLLFPEVLGSPGSFSLGSESPLTNLMGHSLQMCASLCLHAIAENKMHVVTARAQC